MFDFQFESPSSHVGFEVHAAVDGNAGVKNGVGEVGGKDDCDEEDEDGHRG